VTKVCHKCHFDKNEGDFSPAQFLKKSGWCKSCISFSKKSYYQDNKKLIHIRVKKYQQGQKSSQYRKLYYIGNKDNKLVYNRAYYKRNKAQIVASSKKYNKENEEKIAIYKKSYQKDRRKIDPKFKLRALLSSAIGYNIKKSGSNKNYDSIVMFLSYTMQELKEHLENQFESWMTWNNHGNYKSKTWDDNDPTTWTWQIDHIIPHSQFIYISMEDQSFKDCWALSNLRPYSAKQNLIDGARK
jgi:hypothetical protein